MSDRPDPTRAVADADVLAAALFVDGAARAALDRIRTDDRLTLVASDALLDDVEWIVADRCDADLAAAWRAALAAVCESVDHPPGDHPAFASARAAGAAHVLSLDEDLLSARAGTAIKKRVETSVKRPDAFVRLVERL